MHDLHGEARARRDSAHHCLLPLFSQGMYRAVAEEPQEMSCLPSPRQPALDSPLKVARDTVNYMCYDIIFKLPKTVFSQLCNHFAKFIKKPTCPDDHNLLIIYP